MREEAARRQVPIVALAVGVPGILDPETGAARDAPYVDWEDFPVVDRLAARSTSRSSSTTTSTLPRWPTPGAATGGASDDFVTFSVGTGTGAAIVSNGRLLKGRHNAAGEIGNLIVRRELLGRRSSRVSARSSRTHPVPASPGAPGSASTSVADPALEGAEITPEAVLSRGRRRRDRPGRRVRDLLDDLAMAIVALICTSIPIASSSRVASGDSLEPYLGGSWRGSQPSVPAMPASSSRTWSATRP